MMRHTAKELRNQLSNSFPPYNLLDGTSFNVQRICHSQQIYATL